MKTAFQRSTEDKGEDHRLLITNPQFPTKVFPDKLRDIACEFATSLQFHPDYIGLAMLTAISAAIGTGFRAKVRNLHLEPSILWGVLVGQPGIGKTHIIDHLFKPFTELDNAKYDLYEKELESYESEQKGVRPKFYQSVLRDFTFEALAESSKVNPKGCILLSDEILSMTGNWNKYNKGNDLPYYLTLFSGHGISTSRKTQAPVHTKQSCVNIIGGIQPAKLRALLTKDRFDSGFADRFLFTFPDAKAEAWNHSQFDTRLYDEYSDLIKGIRELTDETITIGFDKDAWEFLSNWQQENTAIVNDLMDTGDQMAGTRRKWESYICRFALQLQVMDTYCNSGKAPRSISLDSVKKAESLFDYFLSQTKKVYGLIARPDELDNLKDWQIQLLKELPDTFTIDRAEKITDNLGMARSTLFAFLDKSSFFKRIAHGKYIKRIKDGY